MREILKGLPTIIIAVLAFIIISIMDFIWISMALCIKTTRLILMKLASIFDFDDKPLTFEGHKTINNHVVNYAYKNYIDLMYPTEEDEEESE